MIFQTRHKNQIRKTDINHNNVPKIIIIVSFALKSNLYETMTLINGCH